MRGPFSAGDAGAITDLLLWKGSPMSQVHADGSAAANAAAPAPAARPQLAKVLGLTGAVAFGLAYMMPMASFTTYGVVNTLTEGGVVTAYIVTLVAMLFTASSYAAMSRAFPAAGAAYSYTRRTLGGHVGFLSGWTILLDYVLLPTMAYLVIGIYMHAAVPQVPQWVWIAGTILIVTALNVLGVKLMLRSRSSRRSARGRAAAARAFPGSRRHARPRRGWSGSADSRTAPGAPAPASRWRA